ncbi:hypothetical protein ACWGQ2_08815 [Arthrobacter sp. NPDC055585]
MSYRARWVTGILAVLAVVVAGAVALAVTLNRPAEAPRPDPVAATVPLALTAQNLPGDFTVGVVLTYGQSGEPGSEYNRAAQGAVVAAQRFSQGGTSVSLRAQNDGGTREGAREAVRALAEQGVSGLVVASTGMQAQAAAKAAEELGLPVILPYAEPADPAPSTWTTKPTAASIGSAVESALDGRNRILLVSDGGSPPPLERISQELTLESFDDVMALAQEAAILTGDQLRPAAGDGARGTEASRVAEAADAVIVSAASPQRLARLVHALQSRDVSVPLMLPEEAASPHFAAALAELDGTVSGQLISVAAPGGDSAALMQDAPGRGMSAFLSAVRLAAGDPDVRNLTADGTFTADAWAADSSSHDAVIALVRAAAFAESGDPKKVAAALAGMSFGAGEGLAGPPLDFSRTAAMTSEPVPVFASSQDLGLRPADGNAPRLIWIPAPQDP